MPKLQNITPEEFKLLYDSMSQKQLCRVLNVTFKTVKKRREKYGLPVKPKGRPIESGYHFKGENVYTPEVQALIDRIKQDQLIQEAQELQGVPEQVLENEQTETI